MPKMISSGGKLIRINPTNNHIEFSPNNGVSWVTRSSSTNQGIFKDLVVYDGTLYACTDKGVYFSPNEGVSWLCKSSSLVAKTFSTLQDNGRELLGMSEDGHLYFSPNKGVSWLRRK